MAPLRSIDPPTESKGTPLASFPGARLGLVLGIASLPLFLLVSLLFMGGNPYLVNPWAFLVALVMFLVSWILEARSRAAVAQEPARYRALGNMGMRLVKAGWAITLILIIALPMMVSSGSRGRAREKVVQSHVSELTRELARALDELKAEPSTRAPGLPKNVYPDSAEGAFQMAQDAVQIVMNQPFVKESRNPYGGGPIVVVGPASHRLGMVYVDISEARKPRVQKPVITLTGVYQGRDQAEGRLVKILEVY